MAIAAMLDSSGSRNGSMSGRLMRTEVSSTPRSQSIIDIGIGRAVEIFAEAMGVDHWRASC